MSDIKHVTATGDILAQGSTGRLLSVVLTPAAAKSTVVVRTGGSGGTIKLSLQAAADGNSAVWVANAHGPLVADGIHVTITGASAAVDVEFEQ